MRYVVSSLLLALVVASCVAVNTTQLGAMRERLMVPAKDVVFYRTADQVPGKYEEVALLNASGDSFWTNEAQMHARMRQEAGKLGANAVILDAMSEPSAGAKVAGAIFGVGTTRKGKAIAIFVLPEESSATK